MSTEEKEDYLSSIPEAEAELKAAELVYETRREAGLTQKELAARLGIAQNNISAIERGKRTPSIATLARIASATGKRLAITIS